MSRTIPRVMGVGGPGLLMHLGLDYQVEHAEAWTLNSLIPER